MKTLKRWVTPSTLFEVFIVVFWCVSILIQQHSTPGIHYLVPGLLGTLIIATLFTLGMHYLYHFLAWGDVSKPPKPFPTWILVRECTIITGLFALMGGLLRISGTGW